MAVNISDKLAWVRSHLRVWLAVSCSSLLLLIPRVMSVVVFFWPLIVSTALFVAALLTVSASAAASGTAAAPLELEDHSLAGGRGIEEGESSFSVEESCAESDSNRSLLECVKEQHEGGLMLFHSMFDRERPTAGVDDGLTTGENVKPAAGELKNGENPPEAVDAARVTRNGEEREEGSAAAESRTERPPAGEPTESRPEQRNAGP